MFVAYYFVRKVQDVEELVHGDHIVRPRVLGREIGVAVQHLHLVPLLRPVAGGHGGVEDLAPPLMVVGGDDGKGLHLGRLQHGHDVAGVLGGVKLLQTQSGFIQDPLVRWLPSDIYNSPEYRQCHLLYYTGITRTAKQILAEIVRRMFLNNRDELALLRQMKDHAMNMYEALQRQDFQQMGQLVRQTWEQNQLLDSGTNPEAVRRQTALIDDLCLGYKLPGAGGGGYLYMVAKDPEAAARIKKILMENRINDNARFVDMSLSHTGLQISRS